MSKTKIFSRTNNIPVYQVTGSSGVDLKADIEYFELIPPKSKKIIPTGIHISLPEGFEAQIRSRSGLAAKYDVFVENSPGTIDQGYFGEIKIILYNLGEEPFKVNPGDRIAQMVLCPISIFDFEVVNSLDELGNSDRGQGGLGSTGVN